MGKHGGTGPEAHGIRPDLGLGRWRFARSPVGPSKHQLWDVKTIGVTKRYYGNFQLLLYQDTF